MFYDNLIYDSCNIITDDINNILNDYISDTTPLSPLSPNVCKKQKLISNTCRQQLNKLRGKWTTSRRNSLAHWDKINLIIDKKHTTNGILPRIGSRVFINYSIHRTNGLTLDYSRKGEWITVGVNDIIPGINMALLEIRKGENVKIYIPSHLGYGWQGREGSIPPHTDLVVNLRLIRVQGIKK